MLFNIIILVLGIVNILDQVNHISIENVWC